MSWAELEYFSLGVHGEGGHKTAAARAEIRRREAERRAEVRQEEEEKRTKWRELDSKYDAHREVIRKQFEERLANE